MEKERNREAWGGRVGCRFDLGVLLEKGITNIHDTNTQTDACAHTNAPCRAACEADARCLVSLHFPRLRLARVEPEISLLQRTSKPSQQPNMARHQDGEKLHAALQCRSLSP